MASCFPKHLCPPEGPLLTLPDPLASAGWRLHGNGQWGGGCGGSSVHLSSIATVLFRLVCALNCILRVTQGGDAPTL
jgi:hypothetical protein